MRIATFRSWRRSAAVLCGSVAVILGVPTGSASAQHRDGGTGGRAPSTPNSVYTVGPGDYLFGIAAKLSIPLGDLLAANGLTTASLIHAGDQLKVPVGETSSLSAPVVAQPLAVNAAPRRTYVVRAGDSLAAIARRNGVTLKAILAANGLVAKSTIVPGTSLVIPSPTIPDPSVPAQATSIDPGAAPSASVPTTSSPAPTAPTTLPTGVSAVETLVAFLRAQIGKPYAFNTAGPDTYDCSGLVTAAFSQLGIALPHQSLLQSALGTAVDWRTSEIQAGDLVFSFSTGKTYISHVGIAISSTQWIQASGSGIPVKLGLLPSDERIQTVRRFVSN